MTGRAVRAAARTMAMACALLATAPGAASPQPDVIAYSAVRPGPRSSVFTIGSDGANNRLVLDHASAVQLSPDARRLAYADDSWSDGLWVAHTDGTHRTQLVDPGRRPIDGRHRYRIESPNWSPDAKRILFSIWYWRPYAFDAEIAVHRIVVVPAVGGHIQVLSGGTDPAWSRSGQIAVATAPFDTAGNQIRLMRPDGSHRRLVLRDHPGCFGLAFSPDSRRLLYREYVGRHERVRVLDLRTSVVTTVVNRSVDVAAWTPGGQVVYSRLAPGPPPSEQLRLVRADGSDDRLLFTLPPDHDYVAAAQSLSWRRPR